MYSPCCKVFNVAEKVFAQTTFTDSAEFWRWPYSAGRPEAAFAQEALILVADGVQDLEI